MVFHISPAHAGGVAGQPASKFPVSYINEGPVIYKASGGGREPNAGNERKIDIQYLGVSGYLIKWAGETIMTAPSYTNPDVLKLISGNTPPSEKNIKRQLDFIEDGIADVSSILVGHAHYDHLMDVPYLMNTPGKAVDAKLYGSQSMNNIIVTAINGGAARIEVLNDLAVDPNDAAENASSFKDNWQYTEQGNIRFLAIKSDHAPNFKFLCLEFTIGSEPECCLGEEIHPTADYVYTDADRRNLFEWKEGETFTYLIDFLDQNKNIAYRMHYSDAASEEGYGQVPAALLREKSVDLGVLTVGNYAEVKNYPERMMANLNANRYILGHWESFFGNTTVNPVCEAFGLLCPALLDIPLNNTNGFIKRLISEKYSPSHYFFAKWLGTTKNLMDEFAILPEPNLQMTILVDR